MERQALRRHYMTAQALANPAGVASGINTTGFAPAVPPRYEAPADHALKGTSGSGEREAKLRARHARKFAAPADPIKFPNDAVCRAVVHACFDLRRAGFRDGEIDDEVGRRFRLEGWLVQHIVIFYAEQKVRDLEAALAMNKGVIDAMRAAGKQTWEDAPGRAW